MPDFRTHNLIRDRNDLRWFQRGVSLRRWYGRLSCLAVLVSAALLVGWTIWGDERVYWSAPVSQSHAMFQQDCQACHVQPGVPLLRLTTLDDRHHSVRDSDCQACHAQASHDHSSRMQKEQVTGCVECHREHLGHERLADVADRRCVQCHADLQGSEGDSSFATAIVSFEKHPDFLPFQEALSEQSFKARFPDGDAPVENVKGMWRDRTALRFNHAKHLVDVGVLTAPPTEKTDTGHADRKVLSCNDCHVPDASGQYMQPINYEQHCAACHKLEFSTKLAIGGPLPHETPNIVFGLLRDRLMQYADLQFGGTNQSPREAPRLPNKVVEPTAPKDKWEFVESQLRDVDSALFTNVEQGCAYCHAVVRHDSESSTDRGVTIVPPRIPGRWFTHSRFDHGRHREVSCVACHDPKFAERTAGGHAKFGLQTQLTSELSSDILMPRIETCHACHGNQARNTQMTGARSHCVDCHDYHAPHPSGSGKLDRWLSPRP